MEKELAPRFIKFTHPPTNSVQDQNTNVEMVVGEQMNGRTEECKENSPIYSLIAQP